MDSVAELLKEHFNNHPGMEPRDAVKFLYQSYMGGGHLIPDESTSLARLEAEWAQVDSAPSAPLGEPLGNGLYRLHLNACKGIGLSPFTINRLFFLTAQSTVPDPQGLAGALNLVDTLPFSREIADDYLVQYRVQGCPLVSHSETYRAAYSPAYRIVSSHYGNLIPLLFAIDRQRAEHPQVRVAIDGPCASGKSTLGRLLSQIYRCPLVHMDDFFLQPEQRTPSRLSEPGGNVEYERVQQEVLAPLCRGDTARYRPWQCHLGKFGPEIVVDSTPLTVVEGSYSLHPALRDAYHLRVWTEAPWPVRSRRLQARDKQGALLERFLNLWIPMEDRYFSACHVKQCCHLSLSGTDLV
ncbi:MAG: uridine kinase [Lawsonibacter sp.]